MDNFLNTNTSTTLRFHGSILWLWARFLQSRIYGICVSSILVSRFTLEPSVAESMLNSSLVGLSVLYLMQGGDAHSGASGSQAKWKT